MNIELQRKIDRWLGVFLCRILSLWPRRPALLPQKPHALVVMLLSEMGSLVLATPMLTQLRTSYPNTNLYVLVFAKNREVLDLLVVIPPINVLTIRDTSAATLAWDCLRIIWQLRSIKPAAVIDCELFARISSILARLSGAPIQVGFHRHKQEGLYRGDFINRPVLYNPYLHMTQQYLNLANSLSPTGRPGTKNIITAALPTAPRIAFSVPEIDDFFAQLYQQYPMLQQRRIVLLYPSGGILPIRAWPLQAYLEVATTLINDGLVVGIIGLRSDQTLAAALTQQCASPWCINLAGYTKGVRELLLLFQRTALLITNDGGPGQFAALTTMPTIVLFGPETPVLYGTLSNTAYCFFAQLACSPCLTAYNHRNTPCDGDNRCLKAITVNDVLIQAKAMLAWTK